MHFCKTSRNVYFIEDKTWKVYISAINITCFMHIHCSWNKQIESLSKGCEIRKGSHPVGTLYFSFLSSKLTTQEGGTWFDLIFANATNFQSAYAADAVRIWRYAMSHPGVKEPFHLLLLSWLLLNKIKVLTSWKISSRTGQNLIKFIPLNSTPGVDQVINHRG